MLHSFLETNKIIFRVGNLVFAVNGCRFICFKEGIYKALNINCIQVSEIHVHSNKKICYVPTLIIISIAMSLYDN